MNHFFSFRNRVLLDPASPEGGGDDAATKAAIEKARLEERARLQRQLEELQAKNTELANAVSTTASEKAAAAAELEKVKADLAALKAGVKADGNVDVGVVVDAAVRMALDKQGTALSEQIRELRSSLDNEKALRQKADLATLRQTLIDEAGGREALIPELVQGNDEAGLRASIENSKAIFARVAAQAGGGGNGGGSTTTQTGAGNIQGPPNLPVGNRGGGSSTNPAAVSGFRNGASNRGGRISTADYAKQRDQLRANALSRLGT